MYAVCGLLRVSRRNITITECCLDYLCTYILRCVADKSSERQNSDRYVGFSQQGSELGGSHPQDRLRQASGQRSSLNTEAAASSDYSQGRSRSDYMQAFSPAAQSRRAPVMAVQSKPKWRLAKVSPEKAQNMPNVESSGLSASIASGSYVSKQSDRVDSNTRTWPARQLKRHAGKYPTGRSASSPPSQRGQKAAQTPALNGQRDSPVKPSTLFSEGKPVRMQTSATVPARRVNRPHGSKPSIFQETKSKPFNVNGGYKPLLSLTSSRLSNSQSLASSTNSDPESWNRRNGASESRHSGRPGVRVAPTTVHDIPDHFGGFAIRRLKTPREEGRVRKPQQTYKPAPQRGEPSRLHVGSGIPESSLKRYRLSGRPAGEYLITLTFCTLFWF